jgi:hypothetical protein
MDLMMYNKLRRRLRKRFPRLAAWVRRKAAVAEWAQRTLDVSG